MVMHCAGQYVSLILTWLLLHSGAELAVQALVPTTPIIIPSPLPSRRRSSALFQQQQQPSSSTESTPPSSILSARSERALGLSVLLTVPLAWGTYSPAVKYLYDQLHVPGLLFSAAYYTVAALTLGVMNQSWKASSTTSVAWRGGLELGSYLFVGNLLQLAGLLTVPADRAGFLVQLTTLIVPVLESLLKQRAVSTITRVSCGIAFLGVLLMDIDPHLSLLPQLSVGDGLIGLAAIVYSLHVVRLEPYAQQTTAVSLAFCKATTEAMLSVLSLCVLWNTDFWPASRTLHDFVAASTTSFDHDDIWGPAIGAVLWTGWITSAYTIFAQSFGQQRVRPSEANLVYSAQPICTAIVAYLLLGETLGLNGVVGGGLIALAVYLVAVQKDEDDNNIKSSVESLKRTQ